MCDGERENGRKRENRTEDRGKRAEDKERERERVHITHFRSSPVPRFRYTKYPNFTCMNTEACIQVASNGDLRISRLAPQPTAVELREGAARLVQVFPPRRADGPVDAAPPEAPCVGRVYDGV